MIDKIGGKHRGAPEGNWLWWWSLVLGSGGGIKIICIHILYGAKAHKSHAWEKIKQCGRGLIFYKHN